MSTDGEIEKEIIEKGLTAPRVTPERIEWLIALEYYLTGDVFARNTTPVLGRSGVWLNDLTPILSCLTLCVLVLRNGFTVTGESACASPENFDAAIGRKIARQKAVEKIWVLEGYLLRDKIVENGRG